ncbi:MAG: HIT domain-containing protein, partial [Sulfolobus sp.]|nr:HIT domain-containing protein [Sulfolobus sp.]
GHTLVMPKQHFENYLEAPEEFLSDLAKVVKTVAIAVKSALKADGIRILTNVGESAGQVIFHLHVHIVPTWIGEYPEDFKSFIPRKQMSEEYYNLLQKVIKEYIKKIKEN